MKELPGSEAAGTEGTDVQFTSSRQLAVLGLAAGADPAPLSETQLGSSGFQASDLWGVLCPGATWPESDLNKTTAQTCDFVLYWTSSWFLHRAFSFV
jgi:hypothetical protein